MIEGAVILIFGMAIGYAISTHFPKESNTEPVHEERKYDKYRNEDGLYSPRRVREKASMKSR